MSDYQTGNQVPSIDPRDLDDNATVFDSLLNSMAASVPDRLSRPRKTWHQMELDAEALVSPNVATLAGLTLSANKGVYATGGATLATYDLTALGRTLGGIATAAAGRTALSAMALTDTGAYAGSAAKLTTVRSVSATGDATWAVNFDGSANATAAITLAASGVSAGTYGSVTVNAKGLVTAASVATPIANGGTGATTAAAALTALGAAALASPTFTGTPLAPTPAVGTNTAQLATGSMVQSEISNKRAWTAYTPTVTAQSGAFTAYTATGKYMVAFGICHIQLRLTITTKGSGALADVTLPFPALAGSVDCPIPARETAFNGKVGAAVILPSLTTARCKDYANADLITTDGCVIIVAGSYPIA